MSGGEQGVRQRAIANHAQACGRCLGAHHVDALGGELRVGGDAQLALDLRHELVDICKTRGPTMVRQAGRGRHEQREEQPEARGSMRALS